jgi:hypothetical protein
LPYLSFLQRYCWNFGSSEMLRHVDWQIANDVSRERSASIFRAEYYTRTPR